MAHWHLKYTNRGTHRVHQDCTVGNGIGEGASIRNPTGGIGGTLALYLHTMGTRIVQWAIA